jgi:hypothetical protein
MVKCNFCNIHASLKFENDKNQIKYTCAGCVKKYNITNSFSRLHCYECLNFGGWKVNKRRYCFLHKPSDAIVSSPKCIVCHIYNATFGIQNKPPEYCKNCMDKTIHVNVKVKKCIQCGIKNAYFKNINETLPKYCGDCKTLEMRSIKAKYCDGENCNRIAYYGYIGLVATKCNLHKEPYMRYLKKYAYLSTHKCTTLKNKTKRFPGLSKGVHAK